MSVNNKIDKNLIAVELVGSDEDSEKADLADFADLCQAVRECLKRAEVAVTGKPPKLRYTIGDLRTGSAVLDIDPVAPPNGKRVRNQTVSLFKRTLRSLEGGKRVDPRLSRDDISQFRRLVAPLKSHAKSVTVGGQQLTERLANQADKILGEVIASLGFVSGIIEGLNVHNRFECTLYSQSDGHRITCLFEEPLLKQVHAGFRRHVTVRGLKTFHADSHVPHQVRIDAIEIHPEDNELPTLRDVMELGPWDTGGKTAVQFVRAIRNEA